MGTFYIDSSHGGIICLVQFNLIFSALLRTCSFYVPFFFYGYQLAKSFENAHCPFFIFVAFFRYHTKHIWIPHSRCYHDWCSIPFFLRISIPNSPFHRQSAPAVNLWKWLFWIQSWLASNYPKLDIYSFESFL